MIRKTKFVLATLGIACAGTVDGGERAQPEDGNIAIQSGACAGFTPDVCRMRMRCCEDDPDLEAVIEVRRVSPTRLAITDAVDSERPWTEVVELREDGTLLLDAGVPEMTCEGLLADYRTLPLEPDRYEVLEGFECSEIDGALVRFLVLEWFYFG